LAKRDLLTDCISLLVSKKSAVVGYPALSFVADLPNPRRMMAYFRMERWHFYVNFMNMLVFYLIVLIGMSLINYISMIVLELDLRFDVFSLTHIDPKLSILLGIGAVVAAMLLSALRLKAQFVTSLYGSIVHRPPGNQQALSRFCDRLYSGLPMPDWIRWVMTLVLPTRVYGVVYRAFYGKALHDPIFNFLRFDRASAASSHVFEQDRRIASSGPHRDRP
jgi:hypothetical protein